MDRRENRIFVLTVKSFSLSPFRDRKIASPSLRDSKIARLLATPSPFTDWGLLVVGGTVLDSLSSVCVFFFCPVASFLVGSSITQR